MSIRSWLQQRRAQGRDTELRGRRAEAGAQARRRIISEKAETTAAAHQQVRATRELGGPGGFWSA